MSKNDLIELFYPDTIVRKIVIKEVTPCAADPDRIKFIAEADRTLEEALPILYLGIPNAKYSEKLGALSYRLEQHLVTIFASGRIGITYVKDRQEAEKLVEDTRKLINRALLYQKTHGKPEDSLFEAKKTLSPQTLYEKLPKTNCHECSEQSCYAFATKLFNKEKTLDTCPPLSTRAYAQNREQLQKLLKPIELF
jgi:ArsR family metal-binding transcriptional regulator